MVVTRLRDKFRRCTTQEEIGHRQNKETLKYLVDSRWLPNNQKNLTSLLCIDPIDPDAHVTGSLLNIWSGQVVQPNVNVDRALGIGAERMTSLRDHGQMIFIP